MAHANSWRDKREIQHNTHNRRAGVAKFKRNISHRKRRRWDNRIRKQWVEERDELGKSSRSARNRRNDNWERIESQMPTS